MFGISKSVKLPRIKRGAGKPHAHERWDDVSRGNGRPIRKEKKCLFEKKYWSNKAAALRENTNARVLLLTAVIKKTIRYICF